jgi:hypothetical protein
VNGIYAMTQGDAIKTKIASAIVLIGIVVTTVQVGPALLELIALSTTSVQEADPSMTHELSLSLKNLIYALVPLSLPGVAWFIITQLAEDAA